MTTKLTLYLDLKELQCMPWHVRDWGSTTCFLHLSSTKLDATSRNTKLAFLKKQTFHFLVQLFSFSAPLRTIYREAGKTYRNSPLPGPILESLLMSTDCTQSGKKVLLFKKEKRKKLLHRPSLVYSKRPSSTSLQASYARAVSWPPSISLPVWLGWH